LVGCSVVGVTALAEDEATIVTMARDTRVVAGA